MTHIVRALGLMSGTSADGIDAALIQTDGEEVPFRGSWLSVPYEPAMRTRIHAAMRGEAKDVLELEQALTLLHAEVVQQLLEKAELKPVDISVIGFHGQTVVHRPAEGLTWQIGNGALLAEKTGISVVSDFRRRDVAAGGEGAPLVPLYHAALARHMDLPVAVVNIGGIANVTWVGRSEHHVKSLLAHDIIAFDTGPGNVLMDEWVRRHTGRPFDHDGGIAGKGKADMDIVRHYMADAHFTRHPPKSLDRHHFTLEAVEGLSLEDGAATLAEFTAESIAAAHRHFPAPAKRWLIAGGGRCNPVLLKALSRRMEHVEAVEAVGWEGDALEAQAFAYLAVRSMVQLPLSLPTTTGAHQAVTGGAFYPA